MKLPVLHLTHDDKFIDHFIHDFDIFDEIENKFIVYTEYGAGAPKFVKSKQVLFAEKGSPELDQLIGDLSQYSAVFIHFLTPYLAQEILSRKTLPPLFLMFWGGEIFSLPDFFDDCLGDKSAELMSQFSEKVTFRWAWKPKNLMLEYKRYKDAQNSAKSVKKALSRFDFFCHYIPSDFDRIKGKIDMNCDYINFNYGSIQSILADRIEAPYLLDSPNVLVGNSAAITNNHQEILELLGSQNIKDRKVYAPLSYDFSPSESYADSIARYGKTLFGEEFIALRDFMERSNYNKIFDSVGFVFMNHYRSQGAGSALTALYLGKKVFLSEQNSLYGLLKSWGIHLFSIEAELIAENDNLWIPLSSTERNQNRSILMEHFDESQVRLKYRSIIKILLEIA